jgi:hypothetical protein
MVAMTDRLDTIPITCCRWPGPRSDRPERWPLASHTTQHHALRGYVVSAAMMAASVGPAPGALPRSRSNQSRALLITHSGGGVHPAPSMQRFTPFLVDKARPCRHATVIATLPVMSSAWRNAASRRRT